MGDDKRVRTASEPRTRASSVVVVFPGLDTEERAALVRMVPSGRVLLLAFAFAAAIVGGYFIARESPVFAVQRIEVDGATPNVTRQVARALGEVRGRSLLKVDAAQLEREVESIPTIRQAVLDRSFPNSLRVIVIPERAVAVARQGSSSWLISDRGRVMHKVKQGKRGGLPRIWVPRSIQLEPGSAAGGALMTAITAVAPLDTSKLLGRVGMVTSTADDLTLRMRSGLKIQLGEPSEIRLKLAIVAKIMPALAPETVYLDVSVPERPVAGTSLNSLVDGETSTSTNP